MKRNLLLLLPVLIGIMMTSCRTSALLTATFESDAIGNVPARNIPGAPEGDEITYSNELRPRIKVVASSKAGEKALEFSQAIASGLTAHNQWLGFRGTATDLTEPVYFYYTAVQSGDFNGLLIDLSDGAAHVMARMYITGSGQLRLVRNLATGEGIDVGTIPAGTPHTIVFGVNTRKGTYNLTVLKSGGNITSTDNPLITPDPLSYANPARPVLSFRYDDLGFPSNRYVLENVYISRKQP